MTTIPNKPITHFYKVFPNGINRSADHMAGFNDGSSAVIEAELWNYMIDVSGATWDAATASYWVAGVDTSDPMTDNPVDEADAFGRLW